MTKPLKFKDENDLIIDHLALERNEQLLAEMYIKKDSVVLELGARYGTVSCTINRKLSNPKNQVSVEPDERVLKSLEKNKKANKCEFHIVKGVISKTPLDLTELDDWMGYGTTSVKVKESKIPNYTLEEIEKTYDLKFNTLVIDCEGCLEDFLNENPEILKQIKLIIFEKDYPKKCNYNKIFDKLRKHKFERLVTGFHEVWKKGKEKQIKEKIGGRKTKRNTKTKFN
jgi:FkbM family methyltransferase